jgi:trehalose 6-phosphate phosphatase
MSLQLRPANDALFLDIDGTLLDIAPQPDQVVVPSALSDALRALHQKLGGALALISGRSLKNIDTLFPFPALPAAGAHGAEWRIELERQARQPIPPALRQAVKEAFAAQPRMLVEDKEYSLAVHYRRIPTQADAIQRRLYQLLSQTNEPLTIMRGKMVFEIVYPWHNKGAAIELFLAHPPFAGRRPVFLGDDETDMFAIRKCQQLGGIGIRVGMFASSPAAEFPSPAAVREWLINQAEA